jgi:hypothetical protein
VRASNGHPTARKISERRALLEASTSGTSALKLNASMPDACRLCSFSITLTTQI